VAQRLKQRVLSGATAPRAHLALRDAVSVYLCGVQLLVVRAAEVKLVARDGELVPLGGGAAAGLAAVLAAACGQLLCRDRACETAARGDAGENETDRSRRGELQREQAEAMRETQLGRSEGNREGLKYSPRLRVSPAGVGVRQEQRGAPAVAVNAR